MGEKIQKAQRVRRSGMMKRVIFWSILFQFFSSFILSWGEAIEKVEIFFDGKLTQEGVPIGWTLKEKTGEAEFKILNESNEHIAYFKSNAASFSLERPLQVDPKKFPYLSWKWKVLKLPAGGDVRVKRKNDQAAQLLIVFEGRKVISYLWDTMAPVGSISDESIGWPINLKIKTITVKSGASDLGKWVSFTRNIVEDYRHLFKEEPLLIQGIRIQINSQNTRTIAETLFGRIVLLSSLQAH